MKKFLISVNLLIILVLLVVIVFTHIFMFLPMREEYERTILNNFALMARTSISETEEDIAPFMEGVEIFKIGESHALKIISNHTRYEWMEDVYLMKEGEYTSFIDPIPNADDYWYIRIKNDILFKPIRKISLIHMLSATVILFVLFGGINFVSIKYMEKMVQKLEKSKEKYKEYAIRDALTGTYSRLFFQNWLSKRSDAPLDDIDSFSVVVMIDLDGFKKVNDTYGHLVGDEILTKIGNILKSSVREGDYVIRYGGDEFIILLKECDISFCENIISRIENKIKELDKYNIKMSYGIEKIQDASKLLEHIRSADEKMYRMKRKRQAQDKKS